MKTEIVLFGAGGIGRKALAFLRTKGILPVAFADTKWKSVIEGIDVMEPDAARRKFPHAYWVPTVLSIPASTEVPALIRQMGVKTLPLWTCLNGEFHVDHAGFLNSLELLADSVSRRVAMDQWDFYAAPDYEMESLHEPLKNIYFPDWITRLQDEVFVDCGAADGDSVAQFIRWCPSYAHITAIEPDAENLKKLRAGQGRVEMEIVAGAVSDRTGLKPFLSTGSYCSRLGTEGLAGAVRAEVRCYQLDGLLANKYPPVTFIKMDIEGEELFALNGARETIQKYKPVFAICSYHTPNHFWQVPALIHEIEPSYKLFLRRYAPAPWELICYAVPEVRLIA